ncbi:MAG: NAD(P)/FAD-dependent oxidoreductase, partial [Bradymonadaceae bacterium]
EVADPTFGVRVGNIERVDGNWRLTDADGWQLGTYDGLVVTAPADQAVDLLDGIDSPARRTLQWVSMTPTWSVMLAFDARLPTEFDAAFVNEGPLVWVARNSAKPGRFGSECWVLHSTHEWAADHLEASADEVADLLVAAFRQVSPSEEVWPSVVHRRAHRWRYAEADSPLHQGALWDADRQLVVAGDWVHGSRVEGAFLSGCAAAGRILSTVAAE